ncbi:hypothetical protein QJQ45_002104 [Haematococcus lacustris]|nr:hypothetical protein QJQ45_002104 [Haematococcus lacustris]
MLPMPLRRSRRVTGQDGQRQMAPAAKAPATDAAADAAAPTVVLVPAPTGVPAPAPATAPAPDDDVDDALLAQLYDDPSTAALQQRGGMSEATKLATESALSSTYAFWQATPRDEEIPVSQHQSRQEKACRAIVAHVDIIYALLISTCRICHLQLAVMKKYLGDAILGAPSDRAKHFHDAYYKTPKLLCAVMSIYVPNARNVKSKGKFNARSISLRITNLQRAIIFEHRRLNRFTNIPKADKPNLLAKTGVWKELRDLVDGHDKAAYAAGEVLHTTKRAKLITAEDWERAKPHMDPRNAKGLVTPGAEASPLAGAPVSTGPTLPPVSGASPLANLPGLSTAQTAALVNQLLSKILAAPEALALFKPVEDAAQAAAKAQPAATTAPASYVDALLTPPAANTSTAHAEEAARLRLQLNAVTASMEAAQTEAATLRSSIAELDRIHGQADAVVSARLRTHVSRAATLEAMPAAAGQDLRAGITPMQPDAQRPIGPGRLDLVPAQVSRAITAGTQATSACRLLPVGMVMVGMVLEVEGMVARVVVAAVMVVVMVVAVAMAVVAATHPGVPSSLTAKCELLVMPEMFSAFDVLMGSNWLTANGALLDYLTRTVTMQLSNNSAVLRCQPSEPIKASHCAHVMARHGTHTISASRAASWLRKGGHALVAMISAEQLNTPDSVPPVVSTKLKDLINEYSDVFAPFNGLPPERPIGHTIPLQPGCKPPALPAYRMTQPELAEMKKQITAFLAQGIIEPSSSPYAAPVLFVKKKSGELRMCVDYRQLNKQTLRDQYPLPRIDDLFDKLAGCTVFSSLDLQAGYHQIRIPAEDVPKTAFRTPDGHYQYKVLCFGLTNAPATFQRVMNDSFADVINDCALVYLDDILVMSKTVDEHFVHLRRVLDLLRKHKFFAKLSKCEFMKTALKFLGHIVSDRGVAVDPDKIQSITTWPVPNSLTALQRFLGAANFVRKFVHNFSALAAPLTDMTGKEGLKYDWKHWPDDKLQAFHALKHAVSKVPLLRIPDISKPFQVYCDASLQGVGAVLMQDGHPLAYLSKKLSPAEKNYSTGEQELLAIVTACKEWRCYLEGVPFTLYTDHRPLVALPNQKTLSRRQTRWMELLSRYTFTIEYLPGAVNPADPLSRIPDQPMDLLASPVMVVTRGQKRRLEGEEASGGQGEHAVQRPAVAPPVVQHIPAPPPLPVHPLHHVNMTEQLLAGYRNDPVFADISITDTYDVDEHGLYHTKDKKQIVVPDCPELKARILLEMHDAQFAGHVGITKTLERISRVFWWPRMRSEVRHYVANCDACQRNKSVNTKPGGLLMPLAIPYDRWESITMDLITKLPTGDHGYDAIAVFVDRLSKMVHFVPCKESMNAKGFARLFIDNVFKHHGVPREIISDRGSHFTNQFWSSILKLLGVKECKSSAYHPESDGQTERYNRTLEEMMRHYISPAQHDWPLHLALAEFAVNNSWQESIQSTPFLVNTGQSPLTPTLLELPEHVPCPSGREFSNWWQENVRQARHFMDLAQRRQAHMANKGRKEVKYVPGDLVLLSTKNLRLKPGKARKLLPRFVGPFKVLHIVNNVAVKLDLPPAMSRLHPVFHVSLLRKYTSDFPHLPPPVDWLDETPLYEVEKLLDHRAVRAGRARGYLVKWKGYDETYNTWEPSITDTYDVDEHGLYHTKDKKQIVVPDCPELKARILLEMHDAQFAGHVGITKTLERISRVFWWPRMRSEVRHYVANCDACQRNKSVNTKPGGLLMPLAIPYDRWESITMDLITKLPTGDHGYDAIAVFVDRLSKMVHFVPCKESMNAKGFARLFIDNVFKHHGVPREIISDRGSHFTNQFWSSILKLLGVKECKSSAYHPESDGQTERYNRTLEEMMRHYISPAQHDWPLHLALAEFAVNNSWQESIQSTPFLVNTGQSPLTPTLLELPEHVPCPSGREFSNWWQENVRQARHFMDLAQRRQAHMANKGRKEVKYVPGDLVLLSTKNLRLKPGKARKLLPRFVGPFKVLHIVNNVAVKLDLPPAMSRLHPVFHVSLLRKYTSDFPHLPPPVDWLDETPLYEVEKLLDHRAVRAGRARGYLVKWKGYDETYNTWEPRSNLVNCDEVLAAYNAVHGLL